MRLGVALPNKISFRVCALQLKQVKRKIQTMGAQKINLVTKQGKPIQLPKGVKAQSAWLDQIVSGAKLRPLGGGGHIMAFAEIYDQEVLEADGPKHADPVTFCSAKEIDDAKQGLKERLRAFFGFKSGPTVGSQHLTTAHA